MSRARSWALVPMLVVALGQARDLPVPVVMVADVAGQAFRGGGQPLALAEGIPALRDLRLEAGARLVVIHLKTGEEMVFLGPARIRFDAQGLPLGAKPAGRRTVASLQGSFRLEPGAWAQASVVMRKEVMAVTPFLDVEEAVPFNPPSLDASADVWLQPRGTAVLEVRPEFHWHRPPQSTAVRFRLQAEAGPSVFDGPVEGELLRLAEEQALRPGASYEWRLTWTLPGGEERSLDGGFRVLPEAEAELIRSLRPPPEALFQERLAFAVALESRGLVDEARPYWTRLAAERPKEALLQRFAKP